MSLFDVIRWPISDITESEQLAQLPEDLFTEWAQKCDLSDQMLEHLITSVLPINRAHLIVLIIDTKCHNRSKYNQDRPTLDYRAYKDIYTYVLRKMIREYNAPGGAIDPDE